METKAIIGLLSVIAVCLVVIATRGVTKDAPTPVPASAPVATPSQAAPWVAPQEEIEVSRPDPSSLPDPFSFHRTEELEEMLSNEREKLRTAEKFASNREEIRSVDEIGARRFTQSFEIPASKRRIEEIERSLEKRRKPGGLGTFRFSGGLRDP